MKSINFASMKKQEMSSEKKSKKLESGEEEMKMLLPGLPTHKNKKIVKLSGALKGMKITEEELEEAKHAILKDS